MSEFNRTVAQRIGFNLSADLDGVLVTEVARFGPAWNAGIQAANAWLIQRVNGEQVKSVADFDRALSDVKAGDVVSLDAVATNRGGDLVHRSINIEIPAE